jgi:hypothetical protein
LRAKVFEVPQFLNGAMVMAKDPMGEIMRGRANPDGPYRYGSDAHLAGMREQARRDEANRARNFPASRGRQGGARQSRGGFGSLIVMAIVGFFIWNAVKKNDAAPAPPPSDVEQVARTPPFAMMRNSNQTVAQAQPEPSSPDMKRIAYERQHQPDWERRLGPERVRMVKATLPEGYSETDYLTALEPAFVHFHAHVMFQVTHQDLWEERVGKARLIELKQGLAQGPLGLTDYLDRLEQAAKQ